MTSPVASPVTSPVIRVRDGRFGYGGRIVVEADIGIDENEIVALLGPNGSGKTTLLKGMLGLVDRLGGSVELFGQPIGDFTDRSRIGYVPQRQSAAGPIPVTVRELVRSGRLVSDRTERGVARLTRFNLGRLGGGSGGTGGGGRRSRHDEAAASAAIDAIGLLDMASAPVATLSGGQQRRALVARALAARAHVLLLDEPFAGVDQENQLAIADALRALVPGGVTIVVVLHELGPLESLVTRAVCLDHGRVLFDGALDEAPPHLLHLGHDHDPHGGEGAHRPGHQPGDHGIGLFR